MKKRIVIFSGAGISQESGIKTFRDGNGLWEEYDVMEVATPEAWRANPKLVQSFYNDRRKQATEALPNKAHHLVAELEKHFDVQVITQNIDNLHERAGSTNVLHLHGEITKARSTGTGEIINIGNQMLSEKSICPSGHPLRPHVVWFGEDVPNMLPAEKIVSTADILIVIGTSLNVYPAANLIYNTPKNCIKYLIDPSSEVNTNKSDFRCFPLKAVDGMQQLYNLLIKPNI